ncbi:MAG: PD-(D/E)XK nuclease family protein [Phycisphaerales bacterium]|nr:MAG: PD-(D/E)XK nuclease family protein [Phycisphaerales bacterium]
MRPEIDGTQTALRLTGRDYISCSSITTFQRCPLKYYFQYVVGLVPEFVPSSLIFGTAIHAAVESHFRALLEGACAPSVHDLMEAYQQTWKEESSSPVQFGKGESAESLTDLARRMLEAFLKSDTSRPEGEIVGIEEEFRARIVEDCPPLLGRVDLIFCARAALHLVDFKTARNRWNEAKTEEGLPQMALYAELARPLATALGCRTVRPEWIIVTKTQQPVVQAVSAQLGPSQIARTRSVVRQVWRAITTEVFYPTPSAMQCATCPFQTACRTWEAGP